MTSSEQAIQDLWPIFALEVHSRLEAGAKEYGDRSFCRTPSDLAGETEQEIFDICGWAFVLWVRLRSLKLPTV